MIYNVLIKCVTYVKLELNHKGKSSHNSSQYLKVTYKTRSPCRMLQQQKVTIYHHLISFNIYTCMMKELII